MEHSRISAGELSPAQGGDARVTGRWQHGSQDGKIEPQLFGPDKFLSVVTGCGAPFEIRTRREVHQLRGRKVNAVRAGAPDRGRHHPR